MGRRGRHAARASIPFGAVVAVLVLASVGLAWWTFAPRDDGGERATSGPSPSPSVSPSPSLSPSPSPPPSPTPSPTPGPINTAFEGITTFRGNATRTY